MQPTSSRQWPGIQRATWLSSAILLGCLLAGVDLGVSGIAAEAQKPAAGRNWALLIGVEKYHRVPALPFTCNDVRQLAQTLRTRGGWSEDCFLEMVDTATNPRYQPLKASIDAEVPAFLKQVAPEDSILVFFSGHGYRDPSGKMYLVPLDGNPADLTRTAIAVEWFRQQIAGCKARFKLLILDACHAGSEKGEDDDKSVAAKDLGEPFREIEGVVTLASSTAKEKSQIWEEKQQSLFTYWLNQGLRGHADENSDSTIDIDELYKFVYRNVTRTAKNRLPLPQTPVRIVRSGVPDVPTVIRLRPATLKQVINDAADRLADSIAERKMSKVGVLEFINDTRLGELLGADFGLLGRYCAEELERRLSDQGEGKFSVVDRRRLQKALQEQGFKLDDIGAPDALQRLSAKADGMPVMAVGTLRNRAGRVINLQCKLVQTANEELAGSAGGTAVLNENEWAMLGKSVALKPQDYRPELPTPGQTPVPREQQIIQRLDQRADGPHPLADPAFPYRLKIMIGGQERQGVFRGNDCFIPVRKGEVYEIWIENKSGRLTLMRLLVDGLNTLPEKENTKGVQTWIVGKRVNLDDARAWELDPGYALVNAVRGFVTEVAVEGKLREFVVVDAEQSLAARQKFTDQLGLITAAFYSPRAASRGIGTGLGRERKEKIEKDSGQKPGNLLAVVHLRYVEADALNQ